MDRNTPVCSRGFLTVMKKFPRKNIHEVTAYATDVCDGKKPDMQGKRKKSPHLKIKTKAKGADATEATNAHVRPLYPTLRQLQQKIKGGEPAIVENYIIGLIDTEGDLHLSRPLLQKKN